MTYALGIANSGGRSNDGASSGHLRACRTRKTNARSISSEATSLENRELVEKQPELLRKDALEEMFVASRERFLAVAYSILRNRADAEDAVQEAFLLAYRHLRSFEGRSALRTWLTRIVLNAALMTRRKRKRSAARLVFESSGPHGDVWTESIPDLQSDPETVHAERETLQFIDGLLGKMKPVLRQAFTMTYYDDLSGPEACAMIGVSPQALKARLFRARRKLLDQTERALVTPMRRVPTSSSEFWQRKGLQRLQGLES